MMQNIYLAARYSRYPEMQTYAIELMRLGHRITSRWIWGSHQITDEQMEDSAREELRTKFALEDITDLECANWLISFTETPRASTSRGGRHVEFGIALNARRDHDKWRGMPVGYPVIGKFYRLTIIGPRENVFHCMPEVEHFPEWTAFRNSLACP